VSDTSAWTVSGDMPGSDAKAGAIVIGGHLDSWDPGTGAIDDAAGIAITTAAARPVAATPPRRTIPAVVWGSGQPGGASAAYLAAHKNELGAIAIAGERDLGGDNIYALRLPAGALDAPDIAPLEDVLAPLKIMTLREAPGEAGSDIEGIRDAGVPV